MTIKYPCKVCHRAVRHKQNAVECDLCDQWVHIKCNDISKTQYQKMVNQPQTWYCKICIKEIIPYSSLSNEDLWKLRSNLPLSADSTLSNSTSPEKKQWITSFAHLIEDNEGSTPKCNYHDIESLNIVKEINTNSLGILHLNIASLACHINGLKTFLNFKKKRWLDRLTTPCL